jgi:hypothetical protein
VRCLPGIEGKRSITELVYLNRVLVEIRFNTIEELNGGNPIVMHGKIEFFLKSLAPY